MKKLSDSDLVNALPHRYFADVFQYEVKTVEHRIGEHSLQLECIRDLNTTIDQLFADHEKHGDSRLLEDLCPYFGVIWPSARALCETLLPHLAEIRSASVLELGCGLALPSLLCAKNGAQVTAVDFHPEVPLFLKRNMALNGIEKLRFLSYDWRKEGDSSLGTYDWVLGSDILYERGHPAPVARALASLCAPAGRILLADPARPYLQAFADEMRALGFSGDTRVVKVEHDPVAQEIFILEFRRNELVGSRR